MFRINFTLPSVAILTYFLDDKYKPEAFKTLEKGLKPIKEVSYTGFFRMRKDDQDKYEKKFQEMAFAEKRKDLEELTRVGERLLLAFGTHQIANQLKKFSSRPLLTDCLCLGLQSSLSIPSTLFSLAHKAFVHPIVSNAPPNIPPFYVREFYDFKEADGVLATRSGGVKKPFWYKLVPDMHQYYSTKMKCRPGLFLTGLLTSLFFLNASVRSSLQREGQDRGLFEGKDGLFHQIASKLIDLKTQSLK